MKLTANFEIVDMGDAIIAVPVGEGSRKIHGVLKLNQSSAEILDYLKKGSHEKEIVDALSLKYNNDRASLEKDVHIVVETLKKASLLV